MGLFEGFLWGVFGGILPEVCAAYNVRHNLKKPEHFTQNFYWTMTIIMILLGGGLVDFYLKAGAELTAYLAVHIGATAPLIVTALTNTKPNVVIN